MAHTSLRSHLWCAALALACSAAPARAADAPDFNRDVRPILAAKCFKCHGPDDGARKAKLRFDARDGAAHVLGDAKESELVRRITSTEPKEVMPPPATKVTLTAREKDILKAWVAAGAKYDAHWSFVGPKGQQTIRQSDHAMIQPMFQVKLQKAANGKWTPRVISRIKGPFVAQPEPRQ